MKLTLLHIVVTKKCCLMFLSWRKTCGNNWNKICDEVLKSSMFYITVMTCNMTVLLGFCQLLPLSVRWLCFRLTGRPWRLYACSTARCRCSTWTRAWHWCATTRGRRRWRPRAPSTPASSTTRRSSPSASASPRSSSCWPRPRPVVRPVEGQRRRHHCGRSRPHPTPRPPPTASVPSPCRPTPPARSARVVSGTAQQTWRVCGAATGCGRRERTTTLASGQRLTDRSERVSNAVQYSTVAVSPLMSSSVPGMISQLIATATYRTTVSILHSECA